MEEKIWNCFTETVFSFGSTPIQVNKKNIKEIILSIDETIIKAGFRYQLYEMFSNSLLFDKEEFSLTYKRDRLDRYWIEPRGENIYSILQIHQWFKNKQHLNLSLNQYPGTYYFTKDGQNINKKYFFSLANPLITVYSNYIRLDDFENQTLELNIESYSDIWYDKVYDLKDANNLANNIIDANLNTPRLNSFLLEIEEEIAKYGAKLVKDIDGNMYKTETMNNGILLDGKLIYQKDIEEGRVIPIF